MNLDYVKIPFSNNPSMIRFDGPVFNKSPDKNYIFEKEKQIKYFNENIYGQTNVSIENKLLDKLLFYFGFDKSLGIKDLSLMLEEDFAVMFNGKMELGSVCFPSGWDFSEKLGKDFSFIHEPVADNSKLISASRKLSEYMCKQKIQRWVWTVTTSKDLSEHPKLKKPKLTTFENLYFRVETQTSTPIDEVTSLFLIKVNVYPLQDVWDTKILESINSMSDNVLNYKGLVEIKEFLNKM